MSDKPKGRDTAGEGDQPINVAAWRQELLPLYSEGFLANRLDPEIIELVRALGRLGVDMPPSAPTRRVRTAEQRRQKFIQEAVEIEQTSAQEAGMLGYMAPHIDAPPSTAMYCPVTCLEASEAR